MRHVFLYGSLDSKVGKKYKIDMSTTKLSSQPTKRLNSLYIRDVETLLNDKALFDHDHSYTPSAIIFESKTLKTKIDVYRRVYYLFCTTSFNMH